VPSAPLDIRERSGSRSGESASAIDICRRAGKTQAAEEFQNTLQKGHDKITRGKLRELVVKKHSKDDAARAYVIVLSGVTRELFGNVLRRTIAHTATVALRNRVSESNVRKWSNG
jgi:hypothetical protein